MPIKTDRITIFMPLVDHTISLLSDRMIELDECLQDVSLLGVEPSEKKFNAWLKRAAKILNK